MVDFSKTPGVYCDLRKDGAAEAPFFTARASIVIDGMRAEITRYMQDKALVDLEPAIQQALEKALQEDWRGDIEREVKRQLRNTIESAVKCAITHNYDLERLITDRVSGVARDVLMKEIAQMGERRG